MFRRLRNLRSFFLALVSIFILYFLIFRCFAESKIDIEPHGKSNHKLSMEHDHSMHHSQHVHGMGHSPQPYHDHGGGEDGSGDGSMSMSMNMVFHIGVYQEILFPGWVSTNAGEMVGACVVVFLTAALYEGLKCWREILFIKGATKTQAQSQVNITKQECGADSNCSGQKIVRYPMLSLMHLIQSLLHMFQVFISYLLMLIFMTYNVWLCIALLLGTGFGYFLFGWKKQSVVDMTEHCH